MAKKPTTQYFRNEPDLSTPEGQAYAAAQAAFDLQLIRKKGKPEFQDVVPSEEGVEQAFQKSREASQRVDDSKRISPAYWVTQTDFQDTFGRRYNPMNPQDQQDFFSLVKNAPGARKRTDVAGAAAGEVIPSRQRPESLPTYQDVDGIKIPETALGYTAKEQKRAQDLGFKTAQEFKDAEKYTGAYSEKPRFVVQREVDKDLALDRQMNLLGIMRSSQKPSKKEELPYSERQGGALEDPKDILRYIQQYAPETLTPEQKSALGMSPKVSAEPYAGRAGIETKKPKVSAPPYLLRKPTESKNPPYLLTRPKEMTASQLELDKMKRDALNAPVPQKKLETSSNFPERPSAEWWNQSVTGRPPGIPSVAPSEAMYGTLVGGIVDRQKYSTNRNTPVIEPAPAPEPEPLPVPAPEPVPVPAMAPTANEIMFGYQLGNFTDRQRYSRKPTPPAQRAIPGVNVEGPKGSDAELSKMMRDAREADERDIKRKEKEEQIKIEQMKRDEQSGSSEGFGPGKRTPSALETGTRAVTQAQQFGQNLIGTALGQAKKAGEKVFAIAQSMVDKQRRAGMAQAIGVSQPHGGGEPLSQQQLLRLWSLKNPGKTNVTVGELEQFGKTIYTPEPADVEEFGRGMEVNPVDFNIDAPSTFTQQAIRQTGVRPTPSNISTQPGSRPLTRGRFEFDSQLPASVRASLDRMSKMSQTVSNQPLTKQGETSTPPKERKMMSFTKGMSDAEVNTEFEKIFGKENKDLSIEIKKDMIERFRLGEMVEGGAIFGGDPMYEMEIDPNTGELKLNPKSKK